MNSFLKFILRYFNKILQKLFPSTIWFNNSGGDGKILLTFDDGPNPDTTEKILAILDKYSIQAVFFCIGKNIDIYPELANKIIQQGHLIGNHTYSHTDLLFQSRKGIIREIDKFNDVLDRNSKNLLIDKSKVTFFRPPYGRFDFRLEPILKRYNYKNIMWSVFTYDFKDDINKITKTVSKYMDNNSIVVLHDNNKSRDTVVESIEEIVKIAKEKGFEFANPNSI